MGFKEELVAMCSETPGSRAAVVMSLDGIEVARHQAGDDGLDLDALLVEIAGPLKGAMQALVAAQAGELTDMEIAADSGQLLLRLLSPEYFLALLLEPGAVAGRGRFAVRQHTLGLRRELL